MHVFLQRYHLEELEPHVLADASVDEHVDAHVAKDEVIFWWDLILENMMRIALIAKVLGNAMKSNRIVSDATELWQYSITHLFIEWS